MDFNTQMATLRERSDVAMELGPPDWLTRPHCLEGPLTEAEVSPRLLEYWLDACSMSDGSRFKQHSYMNRS